MRIYTTSLISLLFNTSCALANAYQAPAKFSLGFAVGIILGIGIGLKQRLSLLALDLNEKAMNKVEERTQPIQNLFPLLKEKINESFVGKYAAKVSGYVQPIFQGFLYFSGYGTIYHQAASYLGNFEAQRVDLIKHLNPLPGKIFSLISLGALLANFGYIQQPLISKISVLSGLPTGYSMGKFLMRNFDWGFLGSEAYSAALANTTY